MESRQVSPVRGAAERRFYLVMSLAILAAVLLGFAPSFYLRPWFPDRPVPPERFFLLHGAVFTAWFVLLVVQAALVSARRTALHRRLGVYGGVLALAMVVLGAVGALIAARRPTGFVGIAIPPLQFLVIPLGDMLLFALLVGLALAWRRDLQSHKRLMLLATVNLLAAAFARWPFEFAKGGPPVYFALSDLFILALAAWDFSTRRRLHPVTLWAGLAIIVSQPLSLAVSGTAPWLAFAGWLVGPPG